MRINKKKLDQKIKDVIKRNKQELYKYKIEDINFQYVNIKKNRGEESYNIIVSIDEIETPLILIRDIIEQTCQELNIINFNIIVEV